MESVDKSEEGQVLGLEQTLEEFLAESGFLVEEATLKQTQA